MDTIVKIMKLNDYNTLVITQIGDESPLFKTTDNGIIISIPNLSSLIKYMIFSETISPKILEGILSEYSDYRK
jgi:hypothetical protein